MYMKLTANLILTFLCLTLFTTNINAQRQEEKPARFFVMLVLVLEAASLSGTTTKHCPLPHRGIEHSSRKSS